jgi:hypothetical protein
MIEAQQRLKALQKQEKARFKVKDNFDSLIIRDNSQKSENIRALDLEMANSKIPKPLSFKKPLFSIPDDSRIPKLFKVPLSEIPEKSENLPWKKGDLLDSLDLGSTNLKKLFQNRPKLCHSPGRQKNEDPEWLKENFRVSINEWAPKKIEVFSNVRPTKRVLTKNLIKIGGERFEVGKNAPRETRKVSVLESEGKKIEERKISGKMKIEENFLGDARYEGQEEKKEVKIEKIEKKEEKIEERKEEKIEEKKETIPVFKTKEEGPLKVEVKKQSKFVNKFKAIPENNEEFLDCELECVNDEEEKLKASLARLDLKYLRLKHQAS